MHVNYLSSALLYVLGASNILANCLSSAVLFVLEASNMAFQLKYEKKSTYIVFIASCYLY